MKGYLKGLAVVLVLAVLSVGIYAWADTTVAPAQGKETRVGGLPVFMTFTMTTYSSTGDAVIDGPAGYIPDYVVGYIDPENGASACEWFKGMDNGSAIVTAVDGARTYTTTAGVTYNATTGDVTFGINCELEALTLDGWMARYAQ